MSHYFFKEALKNQLTMKEKKIIVKIKLRYHSYFIYSMKG